MSGDGAHVMEGGSQRAEGLCALLSGQRPSLPCFPSQLSGSGREALTALKVCQLSLRIGRCLAVPYNVASLSSIVVSLFSTLQIIHACSSFSPEDTGRKRIKRRERRSAGVLHVPDAGLARDVTL